MARKIMILYASPRKNGNTHALVNWFTEGAESAGAKVERIDVTGLNYKTNGCIACYGCQKNDRFECVIDDEATPIIARIPEADVLVIATPVYFFGPSAQLKVFLDRGYSLFKFNTETGEVTHNLSGINICLIASGGGSLDDGLKGVENIYKTLAGFIGGDFKSLLVPSAPPGEGELDKNEELSKKARALGREIAEV